MTLRGAGYFAFLLADLFGSFFITLWLTEPQVPNADNGSRVEHLAAHPISSGSDLAKSADEVDVTPWQQLSGRVDAIPRIDEQKVGLAGRSADRQESALEVRRAPTPAVAGIQVSGSADALTIEAHGTSVEDILAALSRAFDMDYRSSIDLDKRLYGTYVGPLSRVVERILQGYNFVLKADNGSISVTVVGTPTLLADYPLPQQLPASRAPEATPPEPQQSGAPAPIPIPGRSRALGPAPVPGQSGAPGPAPIPRQSGAPGPAPIAGLSQAPGPAPIAAQSGAPAPLPGESGSIGSN